MKNNDENSRIYDVIVIGSGISGIMSLKHLQEEGVTNILCLDKNAQPFGVWNEKNHPGVLPSTYTVSSKLYMTITDFPMPEDVAEFPHQSSILKYYYSYAKHFDVLKYVKQNTRVLKVYKENGIWNIETDKNIYYSKNIVVATGTVNECLNIPNDPYYKNFKGEIFHSDELQNKIDKIQNKKILLVGGSDTTSDFASILINKNSVSISIKNGIWFQGRIHGAYSPADALYSVVANSQIKSFLTKDFIDYVVTYETIPISPNFMWGNGGSGVKEWKPKCKYLNSYYVKSREIIDSVSKGIIQPYNGISSINGNNVIFENGKNADFDMIIFCTGYKPLKCFKFLGNNQEYITKHLYKNIFFSQDPSLMFIGFIRPFLTSIPMISEMQTRWISKIITNHSRPLPTMETMNHIILKDRDRQEKEFPCAQERLKTIIDPYDYMNMIADNIDAKPPYFELLFQPKLLDYVLFDSWNHHMFRLNDKDQEKREHAKREIFNNHNNDTSIKIRWLVTYFIIGELIILTLIIWIFYIYRKNILNFFKNIPKYIYKRVKKVKK